MKLLKTEEKSAKATDKKTLKKVFINLLIAIAIMAYFCTLSIVYKQWLHNNIVDVVKVSTMVFLVIALVLIEIAYKKESKRVVIHSFEMLALAIHSLTTMYITKVNNFDFNNYILLSSYGFSIYYVLKTIFITTKARKDFVNGLSDISEIVKKEEPKKKEASKKDKKKKDIVDEPKESDSIIIINSDEENEIDDALEVIEEEDVEDIDVEEDIDEEIEENLENEEDLDEVEVEKETIKETKSVANDKLAQLREKIKRLQIEDKSLKVDEPKKTNKKEEKSEDKKDSKEKTVAQPAKKRGRPRKVTTETSATQKDVKSKTSEIDAKPRKRGRPKKEV